MTTLLTATDGARTVELRALSGAPLPFKRGAPVAVPTKSFRPAPIVEAAMAHNGGGRGMSHRLAQVGDRYLEGLRRARATWPAFSEAEWSFLREALNGTPHEPAALIARLDQGIEDAIALDGLDAKWSVDGPALLSKLRALDFMQKVALVEEVEGWWAERSRGEAPPP